MIATQSLTLPQLTRMMRDLVRDKSATISRLIHGTDTKRIGTARVQAALARHGAGLTVADLYGDAELERAA